MKEITYQSIVGFVIDNSTQSPIPGVKITSKEKDLGFTNSKGSYNIKVQVLDSNDDPKQHPLFFNKPNYSQHIEIPYNSSKDIISPPRIISLISNQDTINQQISEDQKPNPKDILAYNKQFNTPEVLFQKRLDGIKVDLKTKVLSLIYNIALTYGVTQLNSFYKKYDGKITPALIDELKTLTICPNQDLIALTILNKNKLVKQINTSLNAINILSNAIQINEGVITSLDITYNVLKFIPIPSAVLGVGIPISVINNIQDAKTILKNLIDKLDLTNNSIKLIITFLTNILNKVLFYLNILDQIIQICSPNIPTENINTQTINSLESINNPQITSPIITNVNGFEMGIEIEHSTNSLKRKRATARNQQGVIMLKGEWSYSSIEQILIDELVFYIQQNNLKPN